ncbi:hypothetical protein [Pseudoalteromonas sp. OOF1S-7]|uniref:3-hydroxyacyl-ACP dehydratase FabZ family protein n=1 Tax=Pseudoalteromonas sp. OOF1S-7 TaxID=2917757 RepID=UPI001EF53C83|nr:hypothetical protein [Pseudoalteromonas sp. OOF1S-7]
MLSNVRIENDESAQGNYFVSGSAPFVMGHYPGDPVFPGVMSLRCMRQLSDQLFQEIGSSQSEPYAQLKRVSFIDIVRPGDVLNVNSSIKKKKPGEVHIQAEISVDGQVKSKSVFVYR